MNIWCLRAQSVSGCNVADEILWDEKRLGCITLNAWKKTLVNCCWKRERKFSQYFFFLTFAVLTLLYRNGNIFTMFPAICGNVIPFYSRVEKREGGEDEWCSLIPESLTSNHANFVHFEANPAPTICRVKKKQQSIMHALHQAYGNVISLLFL